MTDKAKHWDELAKKSEDSVIPDDKKHDSEVDDESDDVLDFGKGDVSISGILEHPSYKELEQRLTEAEQTAHEQADKALRALSELENARRRAQRDIEGAHKYALEKFAKEIIQVLDSIEHALAACEASSGEVTVLQEGVALTHKLLVDTLTKFSIEIFNPIGEVFDPHFHEAMSMVDAPDAKPNTIVTVIQKGYRLHDRVLRPARVMIAKNNKDS